MKKLVPLLVLVIALGGYFYFTPGTQTTTSSSSTSRSAQREGAAGGQAKSSTFASDPVSPKMTDGATGERGQEDDQEPTMRPLTEAYASADEALAAVLKGAKDYDDSILEQFTQPDESCTWCGEFYTSVRDMINNPQTPQEQRSYLSEILAISGRTENLQSLIEAIKAAPSTQSADLYAEALELAVGKDDITQLLGDQMNATNDTLREASVAALTNQGTRLAADLLIKDLKEKGDPDTYYSQGIGPGEFIPNEEAIPAFQELVRERGVGAGVGIKALLNAGMPGVRVVFDELENSPNPEADAALLRGAEDHINVEPELLDYANQVIARNRNATAVNFAKRAQQLIQTADQPEEEDSQEVQTLAE
jgi:hypothetical protein